MSKKTSRILSAIFRQLKSRPSFDSIGIERYRTLLEKSALAFKPHAAIRSEPCHINGIQAQWLMPRNHRSSGVILYVHGGGYIAGSIKSHTDLAARIAIACDRRVLIFNYGLAPEHPFPEGLVDVKTVYQWLTRNSVQPISIVGDSAGAGLALALMVSLRADRQALPACTVLISPWIDLECKNPSHRINQAKDPMLSQDALIKTARLYTDKDVSDPLISPINNDFKGMPPLLIQAGENEILIDDSKILAEKLKQAGSIVQLEIWEEMFHVWHYFARYLVEGRQAIDHIGAFVNRYA